MDGTKTGIVGFQHKAILRRWILHIILSLITFTNPRRNMCAHTNQTHLQTQKHMCAHTYTNTETRVCTHKHTHLQTQKHTCARTTTRIYKPRNTRAHTKAHALTNPETHVRAHNHTHTTTRSLSIMFTEMFRSVCMRSSRCCFSGRLVHCNKPPTPHTSPQLHLVNHNSS